ncbi:MAG: glycosyltransferase N-terminal domain-containing protein [Lutibacter sp.]|nr:glycosyltransferase N-terminal domain-containing protein [Lutibacter sp.]MDP3314169.1 glycosyltransferase N-terminal domain-containing protein [Lutibacter sp.]
MTLLYNIFIYIVSTVLPLAAIFNKKIKLFIEGRKNTFSILEKTLNKTEKTIWMHCASLGEFEQGRPIVELIKKEFPTKKIVVTFFSPSGFEIRKNYNLADVVCYLPIDTKRNVEKFVKLVNPELAIFVKYEFWPILLQELHRKKIKTILISGIFRENQVFFKWYGFWMRNYLKAFSHFFVQNNKSKQLLERINFKNVTVSGDTRFDRVFEITTQDNTLPFIAEFKNNCHTLVAGSTWKEDEKLLIAYINEKATENEKFIIAPHNMNSKDIMELKLAISKKTILFSEKEGNPLKDYQVFIVDTIGILTKIYSYATIAYVGGGFTKSGVHNVLEPATFGIPIIIGPNYAKFEEVKNLIAINACYSVHDSENLSVLLTKLASDIKNRNEAGLKAYNYIKSNIGASQEILKYIKK